MINREPDLNPANVKERSKYIPLNILRSVHFVQILLIEPYY